MALETFQATAVIDSHDVIGEGPAWDAAQQRILWCDNSAGVVHEAKRLVQKANATKSGAHEGGWGETRQWALNRGIGAAVPRRSGGLMVASGIEILGLSDTGDARTFARIPADPTLVKFNDAKCDSRGRLWAGTRDADFSVPGRPITAGRAALYRIDPDGAIHLMLSGVTLGNGMDWSPDGKVFYFIDTYRRTVEAFDFDVDRGSLSARRTLITMQGTQGSPDGMAVDTQGNLWIAIPGTREVRSYSPEGIARARIEVATPTVTSCAFGGPNGADLFITSARVRLPPAALSGLTHGFSLEPADHRDLGAGALYLCKPGVSGPPAHPFAG